MHLQEIKILHDRYPTTEHYPFNLSVFQRTESLALNAPVVFFMGENGTGKSTLLRAISTQCSIHMWEGMERTRYHHNPYENDFYKAVAITWIDGPVPGSYFSSQIFRNFAQLLDEWASMDEHILDYFGGKSLLTQSHGQSLISFFDSRFHKKGLYLLDEPETALSPKTQLELLRILMEVSSAGMAQFIVATHSPVLLACPNSVIYDFNQDTVQPVVYQDTDYYAFFNGFSENMSRFFKDIGHSSVLPVK
jgi:predicted ATPase